MTTEELVREGIEYLKSNAFGEMPWYMHQFHASSVGGTIITRFSVALNDETKDVRYLERVEFCLPKTYDGKEHERVISVYEVTPHTEVNTVYYPVEV